MNLKLELSSYEWMFLQSLFILQEIVEGKPILSVGSAEKTQSSESLKTLSKATLTIILSNAAGDVLNKYNQFNTMLRSVLLFNINPTCKVFSFYTVYAGNDERG